MGGITRVTRAALPGIISDTVVICRQQSATFAEVTQKLREPHEYGKNVEILEREWVSKKFPAQVLIIFPRWTGHANANGVFFVICVGNMEHTNRICVKAPLRGKFNIFPQLVLLFGTSTRIVSSNASHDDASLAFRLYKRLMLSASENKARRINNRVRREPLHEMKCYRYSSRYYSVEWSREDLLLSSVSESQKPFRQLKYSVIIEPLFIVHTPILV